MKQLRLCINVNVCSQHENYTQNPFGGYPNDACMLKLTTETDVSEDGVGLACLPDESFGDFADNENCWISGWGLDDCESIQPRVHLIRH